MSIGSTVVLPIDESSNVNFAHTAGSTTEVLDMGMELLAVDPTADAPLSGRWRQPASGDRPEQLHGGEVSSGLATSGGCAAGRIPDLTRCCGIQHCCGIPGGRCPDPVAVIFPTGSSGCRRMLQVLRLLHAFWNSLCISKANSNSSSRNCTFTRSSRSTRSS